MIGVHVTVAEGVPTRIISSGHAIRSGSADSAPCAAVSVVLKSFGLGLAGNAKCRVSARAEQPGALDIELHGCDDQRWLAGVWAVTETSLREIAVAWPDQVQLSITEEKRYGA